MGLGLKLINKLKRRRKSVNPNRGFRRQDKIDLKDEVLADSPGAYTYLRGIQRRLDKNFGQQLQPTPEKIAKEILALADLARVDTTADTNPDTLRLTLSTGVTRSAGLVAGDVVTILEGALKGRQYTVQAVDYAADTVDLLDDPDLTASETAQAVSLQISGVKTRFS